MFGDADPEEVTFSVAERKIISQIKNSKTTVNLVIEAPLSVSFNLKGNPTGRSCEREGEKTRYWYVGPGCTVMVAAMYLIRDIYEMQPRIPVRLFEGFVSFRDRGSRSDGKAEMSAHR